MHSYLAEFPDILDTPVVSFLSTPQGVERGGEWWVVGNHEVVGYS